MWRQNTQKLICYISNICLNSFLIEHFTLPSPHIKAICFDIFGVLVVRQRREFVAKHITAENRPEVSRLNSAHELGRITTDKYYAQIAALTEPPVDPEVCRRQMVAERTLDESVMADIREFRQARPEIGSHLLSNTGGDYMDYFPKDTHELFDTHITSAQLGLCKPDLGVFKQVATRLRLHPSEVMVVDDSPKNCQAAREVGMHAKQYTPRAITVGSVAA